ncbi:MAG: rhomboid family intramembrane serine protease [Planctomycetota bacterium]|nr:rhomboid family intramembrane serine protease [Planctomycetota bacterium]
MGFQDRDYNRDSWSGEAPADHLVCKIFMAICCGMFFLELVSPNPSAMLDLFGLSVRAVTEGRVWTLFSYAFLHDPSTPFHIVFNLLVFWWFGTELEDRLGRNRFLAVLAVGILVPAIVYLTTRALGLLPSGTCVIGASGCVNAVLALAIMRDPFRQILLFGVLPMQSWVFLAISLAIDAMSLTKTDSLVASDMHLAGAAAGAGIHLISTRVPMQWFRRSPGTQKRRKRAPAPSLTVFRGDDAPEWPKPKAAEHAPPQTPSLLDGDIDALLAKISREGMASLSSEERQRLIRASEKLRNRQS